jgi:glycosyltransferase involved in cell wall biosynthesis
MMERYGQALLKTNGEPRGERSVKEPTGDEVFRAAGHMQESIAFLIRSLNTGGAERQLVMLATGLRKRGVRVVVVTFYEGGTMAAHLEGTGVHVYHLGKRGRWDVIRFAARLVRVIRVERPAVLYCFLTTANVLGALLRPILRVPRVVLGVRASRLDYSRYGWFQAMEARVAALASRCADVIVCNSQAGKQHCIQEGYSDRDLVVIPNGIDTEQFSFDPGGRKRLRWAWGIGDDEPLVGIVARLDPMKDHPTFLRAAADLLAGGTHARFVCVGPASGTCADTLRALASSLGLDQHLIWTGEIGDLRGVYSSIDVLCSSSSMGEGFSNVIGEAMACERVCVVTDVGDARQIVGDTGRIVAISDSRALASAFRDIVRMPVDERMSLGAKARRRVQSCFSVDRLIDRTQALLY